MNEKLRKRIVYGALVLAIIYGAYNFQGGGKSLTPEPPKTIEPISGAVAAQMPHVSDDFAEQLKAEPWGRNPFNRPRKSVDPGPRLSWTLRGIIYNPTTPLAYINGERVGVGDQVNKATVVAIDKKKVTLEYGGNQFDIFVRKG